jgi:hypothetical protein
LNPWRWLAVFQSWPLPEPQLSFYSSSLPRFFASPATGGGFQLRQFRFQLLKLFFRDFIVFSFLDIFTLAVTVTLCP